MNFIRKSKSQIRIQLALVLAAASSPMLAAAQIRPTMFSPPIFTCFSGAESLQIAWLTRTQLAGVLKLAHGAPQPILCERAGEGDKSFRCFWGQDIVTTVEQDQKIHVEITREPSYDIRGLLRPRMSPIRTFTCD